MIESSETRVTVGLLWMYSNPHLAAQSLDDLFEDFGNAGRYDIYSGTDGFVTVSAKRLPQDERMCMTDVIAEKRKLLNVMHSDMDHWMDEYRGRNSAFVVEGAEEARRRNLPLGEHI